jgi:Putative DnaT-like ssDNA binding protein
MALVVGTNSYITVADADTYFEHSINADAWKAATEDTKTSALVSATRSLDRQNWQGEKYQDAPTQVLDFPRSGLTDSEGNSVDETTVPQEVIDATCEYGLGLIEDNDLASQENTGSNIKVLKAGSAEIEYIRGSRGKRFGTIVFELIGLWLEGTSAYSGPFVSGASNESGLSDTFDLNRGY